MFVVDNLLYNWFFWASINVFKDNKSLLSEGLFHFSTLENEETAPYRLSSVVC